MHRILRLPAVMILTVVFAVLGIAASLTVSRLEERDTFCISCHTQPETVYQQRAADVVLGAGAAPDLSSRHYQLSIEIFRCIDCHRGDDTLPHRLIANALAARDTLIWIVGGADPSLEKGEVSMPLLPNAACTRCHEQTLLRLGFENHFHAYLPQATELMESEAQAVPPSDPSLVPFWRSEALATTVTCTDCHSAHVQVPGAEVQRYLDLSARVYPACEMCHLQSGFGPLRLSSWGTGLSPD